MPTVSWLSHLRRETDRFAAVVRESPLRAHVPAYPDFTVHSLAAHIGRGLRLFHAIAVGGEQPSSEALEVPAGADVADWVLAGLAPLVTVLGEIPADQLVPFPHDAGNRPAGLIAPLLAVEVGGTAGTWNPSSASTRLYRPTWQSRKWRACSRTSSPGWRAAAWRTSAARSRCGPPTPRRPGAPR